MYDDWSNDNLVLWGSLESTVIALSNTDSSQKLLLKGFAY